MEELCWDHHHQCYFYERSSSQKIQLSRRNVLLICAVLHFFKVGQCLNAQKRFVVLDHDHHLQHATLINVPIYMYTKLKILI